MQLSLLSIHCIAVKLPLLKCPPISFSLSCIIDHLVCASCLVCHIHNNQFFVRSLKSSGKERKFSMYNLWPHPSVSLSVLSLWHELLSSVVSCLVSPFPCRLSCNLLGCKVCKFSCQNGCLSWKYIVSKSPFLWTASSIARFSEGLYNFRNVLFKICNTSQVFHSLL